MNYFVSTIRQDGGPGPLYGPYDYDEATEVLLSVLQSNRTDNGPVELTEEVLEVVKTDGFYSFDGGGGVYIVQSEQLPLDRCKFEGEDPDDWI